MLTTEKFLKSVTRTVEMFRVSRESEWGLSVSCKTRKHLAIRRKKLTNINHKSLVKLNVNFPSPSDDLFFSKVSNQLLAVWPKF